MASNSNEKLPAGRFLASQVTGQGIFLTAQRRVIAETLFSRDQHVTAEQLYDQVRLSGHKVSRATVYNTLSLFTKQGLVRVIPVDGSATFYDSNTSHHHHLFNVDTGELVDLDNNLLPDSPSLRDSLPADTDLEGVDLLIRIRNKRS